MSESDVDVNKYIKELGLKNQSQGPVNSIVDLKLVCEDDPELIPKFIDVLLTHLKTEKPVESDAVLEVFVAMFHQNKKASLIEVLKHLTEVPAPKKKWLSFNDEMKLHQFHVLKTHIADLIEKSLEKESTVELQQLAEFLEENAGLDAFDVSDTYRFDRLISCLQIAVPLFAVWCQRGAPRSKFFELVNGQISDFDKLPERRKLDFIKAIAEISSHTPTQVARQMIPSVVVLLKKDISHTEMEEFMSFTYVECLLYMLHQLAHKAPDVATDLCNEDFMSSVRRISSITQARMEKLAKTLPEDDKQVWEADALKSLFEIRRQATKTGIRSCSNILAITKLLKKENPFFTGDNSLKLSWKEAKKPLLTSGISRDNKDSSVNKYSRVPDRSAALQSLVTDCREDLYETGVSTLTKEQAVRLLGLSKYEQVSRNREGPIFLKDTGGVAMLCSRIKESDLNLVKNIGERGRSGKVRNQMYHLLCWTYAASDLVSCQRSKSSKSCRPLCPWYLCAFCKPSKLGNEERAIEPDPDNHIHHCYGNSIESALRHIQENGIPRETVSKFTCTDYQPPSADEPWMEKRKIKHFRTINTLEDALKELHKQPIGADLINYTGLQLSGDHIYYGPMMPYSSFRSYHAVVIEEVKQINNEWVAVCKLSNGELVGKNGYVNVSLATQYIPVGVSAVQSRFVRGSEEPMHLLTDFIVLEDDENETEDDENEDGKNEDDKNEDKKKDSKEDEKPSDEEPEEEYKDYICKSKRGPASAPTPKRGRGAYGRIWSTPSDLLVNNVGMLGIEDPIMVTGSDTVNVIEDAITHHNSDLTTKAMALVAVLKLSSRFPSISERIKDIIVKQKGNLLLEMQQRAIEYYSIVDRQKNSRSSLVERMPVLDEATFNVRMAGSFSASASTMTKPSVSLLNGVEKPVVAPLVDLLDPFLHIRLLRLLRVLGQGDADASDLMTDILAQVATKTESNKNAGNAVLYECVETIMAIEDTSSLRVLAINMLGRFLSNRDNNIRYVALNMLMKAITFDDQAVERHRVTILECVKDPDASIRKRALELVTLLVDENNVTQLTKELIDYLEISDEDFKEDLSAKIYFIVEKFSPEKLWYIDQMLKVLCEVTESDAVDVIEDAITSHNSDSTTKAMALVALLKLSSRFPTISEFSSGSSRC